MPTKVSCYTCVYAYWDKLQRAMGISLGLPIRPACANQPGRPGQMRPTPIGRVCRNYRRRSATPTGDVKPIQLVEGPYAYVDAADYEWVSRYNWHLSGNYAVRWVGNRRIFMHREIMKPPKGMVVDHKDGNGLNNCRFNLRVCTLEQNQWNRIKRVGANTASQYLGVGHRKSDNKYYARFRHRGERFWLGLFDEEIEAARAYDRAAVEHRGEFARVNLPEEWPPERRAEVHAEYLRTGQSSFVPVAKGERQKGPRAKAKGKKTKGKRSQRKTQNAKRTTKSSRAAGPKSRATSSRPQPPKEEDRNKRSGSRKKRKKTKKDGEGQSRKHDAGSQSRKAGKRNTQNAKRTTKSSRAAGPKSRPTSSRPRPPKEEDRNKRSGSRKKRKKTKKGGEGQ